MSDPSAADGGRLAAGGLRAGTHPPTGCGALLAPQPACLARSALHPSPAPPVRAVNLLRGLAGDWASVVLGQQLRSAYGSAFAGESITRTLESRAKERRSEGSPQRAPQRCRATAPTPQPSAERRAPAASCACCTRGAVVGRQPPRRRAHGRRRHRGDAGVAGLGRPRVRRGARVGRRRVLGRHWRPPRRHVPRRRWAFPAGGHRQRLHVRPPRRRHAGLLGRGTARVGGARRIGATARPALLGDCGAVSGRQRGGGSLRGGRTASGGPQPYTHSHERTHTLTHRHHCARLTFAATSTSAE